MASFFRKRIALKVLSMLQKRQDLKLPPSVNLLSSLVKVNRFKSYQPELIIPWKRIEQICGQTVSVSPNELVRLLRNQGLPTAEGFIDIQLSESPVSLIFTVDKHIFSKFVLVDILNNEEDLAKNSCLFDDIKKKNVVVHCSVPSTGDICHMTHFRTWIHTNFVANINKFAGHNVTTVAHVNDWGPEAARFLTGFKQFQTEDIQYLKDSSLLHEIYKASYMEYNSDFKFKADSDACYEKMQKGDPETVSEWQTLKQMCMDYYDSVYQRISVRFDEIYSDSSYFKKFEDISNQLSNYITNKNNCPSQVTLLFYFTSLLKSLTQLTFIAVIGNESRVNTEDSEKKFTYLDEIKDLDFAVYNLSRYINAAVEVKEKYNFDKMYYVIPSSQEAFIKTMIYMLKRLDYSWADDLHLVKLKVLNNFESKRRKMCIETVLDQIKEGMVKELHENLQMELNESLEKMAEQLSLSSLIVNDMKHRRNVNYEFKLEDVINFKRDTAASFQFCSAGLKGLEEDSEFYFKTDIDLSPLLEPQAHYLIQHLARFDEMVFKSYTHLEPCIIFQYLSSLWYYTDMVTNILKVDIKSDRLRVIKARLLLLSATLKIMNKGLHLLGITPLEQVYSPEKDFVQIK